MAQGEAKEVAGHAHRALMLCWPPRETAHQSDDDGDACLDAAAGGMARAALAAYAGNTLIYVGEWEGATGGVASAGAEDAATRFGESGGPLFQAAVQREWRLSQCVALPSWPFVSDHLSVWHRKSTSPECDPCRALTTAAGGCTQQGEAGQVTDAVEVRRVGKADGTREEEGAWLSDDSLAESGCDVPGIADAEVGQLCAMRRSCARKQHDLRRELLAVNRLVRRHTPDPEPSGVCVRMRLAPTCSRTYLLDAGQVWEADLAAAVDEGDVGSLSLAERRVRTLPLARAAQAVTHAPAPAAACHRVGVILTDAAGSGRCTAPHAAGASQSSGGPRKLARLLCSRAAQATRGRDCAAQALRANRCACQ